MPPVIGGGSLLDGVRPAGLVADGQKRARAQAAGDAPLPDSGAGGQVLSRRGSVGELRLAVEPERQGDQGEGA